MTDVYNPNNESLHYQIGFMGSLPSDVIPIIFSYLTRQDCIICMEVCRAWYQLVPQYSQKLWETIEMTSFDVGVVNRCLEQCVGDHVKNVIFASFDKEEHLHSMMQKVLDWGCTKIKSLGI
ncbi:hypothetical protein BJV82DRAFT_616351 [Fennellomyces sp. T-0311]|nr:hypothetical protein BJV82DRAFT_616351 [Fennellomyces sp. T-0311]